MPTDPEEWTLSLLTLLASLAAGSAAVFTIRMSRHRAPGVSLPQLLFTSASLRPSSVTEAGRADQKGMLASMLVMLLSLLGLFLNGPLLLPDPSPPGEDVAPEETGPVTDP